MNYVVKVFAIAGLAPPLFIAPSARNGLPPAAANQEGEMMIPKESLRDLAKRLRAGVAKKQAPTLSGEDLGRLLDVVECAIGLDYVIGRGLGCQRKDFGEDVTLPELKKAWRQEKAAALELLLDSVQG